MKEYREILHGNGCISRFTYKLPMYLNVVITNLTTSSQSQVQLIISFKRLITKSSKYKGPLFTNYVINERAQ